MVLLCVLSRFEFQQQTGFGLMTLFTLRSHIAAHDAFFLVKPGPAVCFNAFHPDHLLASSSQEYFHVQPRHASTGPMFNDHIFPMWIDLDYY